MAYRWFGQVVGGCCKGRQADGGQQTGRHLSIVHGLPPVDPGLHVFSPLLCPAHGICCLTTASADPATSAAACAAGASPALPRKHIAPAHPPSSLTHACCPAPPCLCAHLPLHFLLACRRWGWQG